ncbi:hypothetical protein J6590_079261 [Homalodisca vitripennis]|nr:hypothetical protein J6590_079261 [Homalodisca vitripennis]
MSVLAVSANYALFSQTDDVAVLRRKLQGLISGTSVDRCLDLDYYSAAVPVVGQSDLSADGIDMSGLQY